MEVSPEIPIAIPMKNTLSILKPKNRLKSIDGHYWIFSITYSEKMTLTFGREENIWKVKFWSHNVHMSYF